jgi:hypothetical protein
LAAFSWSSIFQRDRDRTGERNESTGEGRCRVNEQAALFAAVALPTRGEMSSIPHARA